MADVHIGSIRIRAGNLNPDQGRQLGTRVAALLAEALAGGYAARRDVGVLQARVTARTGQTLEGLATQVVTAILEAM